jgi:hypothetical protein
MEIKESKELLIGVNELALVLMGLLKDGLQVQADIAALIAKVAGDEAFKAKLQAAYEGAALIKGEVADLKADEVVELVVLQASYVPKILGALK